MTGGENKMPVRWTRNAEHAQNREELSRDMRRRRLDLFIQQFEKEAQERMNELEAKVENMLATVDKVFKVELMKMPPALQNTLVGDLISAEELSASEVSIVINNESHEMPQTRVPSKKAFVWEGKSIGCTPVQSSPAQRPLSKTLKARKGRKTTRTLAESNSTENLGGSSVTAKRTQSCLGRKPNDQTRPKLRSVVSSGDLRCSVVGSAAHITVTTAEGQAVSFSEETKDEINWDLLDDVARCQIQKLKKLMEYLSQRMCKDA